MKDHVIRKEPARVLMNLSGGYTKVVLERTIGCGLTDGAVELDIPTAIIPPPLRAIGSRFIVVSRAVVPDENDTPDEIRRLVSDLKIEELVAQEPKP